MKKFPKEPILETDNFEFIQRICRFAMENTKMVLIQGETGMGKTTALEYYLKKNSENTSLVPLTKSKKTNQLYREIFDSFIPFQRGSTVYRMIREITFHCRNQEKNQLLILDECGKFKPSDFEYLHEIYDLCKDKMGIVLTGPREFVTRLKKWKSEGINGVPEFFRRIWNIFELDRPKQHEILAICEAYGIKDKRLIIKKFGNVESFGQLTKEIQNHLYLDDILYNDDKEKIG